MLPAPLVGTALASDYVFTANSEATGGGSHAGKRLLLAEHETKTGVPCIGIDGVTDIDWQHSGISDGLTLDRQPGIHDKIYASIKGLPTDSGCGATGSNRCVGTGVYDLSDAGVTIDYSDTAIPSGEVTPHVIGDHPDVVGIAKGATGELQTWTVTAASSTDSSGTLVHGSQLAWAGQDWFVATEAKRSTSCSGVTPSEVWSVVDTALLGLVAKDSVLAGTKLEGIAVKDYDGIGSTICTHSDASDKVVYTTDYCDDRVYALSADSGTKALVEEDDVALPSGCNPSSVAVVEETNQIFVVCQSSGELVEIDTVGSDPCNLVAPGASNRWDLQRSTGSPPTCRASATMADCGGACGAHDIAADEDVWAGWMFVALTAQGQILAIETDDPSNQEVIYQDALEFKPRGLVLASD